MRRVVWTPLDARVSGAGDLAFTYGRYRQTDRAQALHDGYYVHLWLRAASGEWRLAYDIALPAPPPAPS
jgi:ketosteroid isomerase-like protein